METRAIKVESQKNRRLSISIIPGHFATSHSHVNYYIDMTSVKCMHLMAKEAAAELATAFVSVPVETIVCLDGTEIIGAFLARAIAGSSLAGINRDQSIAVITPEINPSNQMLFGTTSRGWSMGNMSCCWSHRLQPARRSTGQSTA